MKINSIPPAIRNKVAIYIRVSTVYQVDRDSLPMQRSDLIAYCKLILETESYEIFEDAGYSGKNVDRPAFQEMMKRVRDGEFTHILVWKIDRISRNLLDFANMYQELKTLGVTFVSKNEQFQTNTAMGEAMLKIILVFAELERNMTSERVTATMIDRASKGIWNGGRIPYGYNYDYEKKEWKAVDSIGIESSVKSAFDLEGLSIGQDESAKDETKAENGKVKEDEPETKNKNAYKNTKTNDVRTVQKLKTNLKDSGGLDETAKFALSGKVGIEEMFAKVHLDLDIFKGGVTEFNCEFAANTITQIQTTLLYSAEISAGATVKNLAHYKMEGLDQKLVPLMYIEFSGATVPFNQVYSTLKKMPLSFGIMLYSDLSGKLTIAASSSFTYNYKFNTKFNIIEDGKFVEKDNRVTMTSSQSTQLKLDFAFSASLKFDIIGVGVMVTVANLTVAEIDVFDLYLRLEGEVGASITVSYDELTNLTNSENIKDGWKVETTAEYSGSVGLFIDLGTVKFKFKLTDMTGIHKGTASSSKTKGVSFEWTAYTLELFMIGEVSNIGYTSGMDYSMVAATNGIYEIYINSEGKLCRKDISTGTYGIYDITNFKYICGVDRTYVYLLQDSGSGNGDDYNIYRLKIDDDADEKGMIYGSVSNKVIAKNVNDVLLETKDSFFYVPTENVNKLIKLARNDL